jgi:eukaryotic-like serine/threonine-protein kinase
MDPATQPLSAVTGQTPSPSEKLEPDLTGRTLGDFRLLRRLGRGGMGEVYLAEQASLKRKVALKLLRADLAADQNALTRFKAEALAVARATHANIVQVYAIGEAEGLHFMALEYVEGKNLREYVEKKGPPEPLVALSIMRQVAAALQRASELGIIHRDIKPENILVTKKGEVKVADFGLSRIFAGDQQPLNLTQSGVTMGTPLYMSPEQVEGKPVDPRTDIYSFGVTAYHLLAGRPPFRGQTPYEVAFQHVQTEPEPLATIRPDLPAELCAVVHKMMAKKPDDRYQTGRDIIGDVVRLRDMLVGVTGAKSGMVFSLGPAPSEPLDLVATQEIPPVRRSSRLLRILGVVSILLAFGGGLLAGWLYYQSASPPQPAVEPRQEPKQETSTKEWEDTLVKLATQRYANPATQEEMLEGLPFQIDLGLLYLKTRRLDSAEAFFKRLSQPPQRYVYQELGKLGEAMVLALRDKPDESNKLFLQILKPNILAKQLAAPRSLLNHQRFREMLAEALHFNEVNSPQTFPASLRVLLRPPAAVLKSAPKKAT